MLIDLDRALKLKTSDFTLCRVLHPHGQREKEEDHDATRDGSGRKPPTGGQTASAHRQRDTDNESSAAPPSNATWAPAYEEHEQTQITT